MGMGGHNINNNNIYHMKQYTTKYKDNKNSSHLTDMIKQSNIEKLKQLSIRFKNIDADTS